MGSSQESTGSRGTCSRRVGHGTGAAHALLVSACIIYLNLNVGDGYLFHYFSMSVRPGTPMPTAESVKRLRTLYTRRRRRVPPGRKHMPPIPGEYLYFDKRLQDSGYWLVGDFPCHFSCPTRSNFGPFVIRFPRTKGVRSKYMEIDCPDPRACPRPTLVAPPQDRVSPDWFVEEHRDAGYASDEDPPT